jgi:hypothetical protein
MGTIQRWWSTRKVNSPAIPDVTPGTMLPIHSPIEGAVVMADSRWAVWRVAHGRCSNRRQSVYLPA